MRVLIVNDEEVSMMGLELMFTHKLGIAKHNVVKAYNGQEAYHLAISQDFDIVLMDLNMPILDGFEACRKIKSYY